MNITPTEAYVANWPVFAAAELDQLRRVLEAAREIMHYEKDGASEGYLHWEEKYQALYDAITAVDEVKVPK